MTLYSVKVLYDYAPTEERKNEELTIKVGDILQVEQDDADWWMGSTSDGRRGFFPANYVEKMEQVVPVQRQPPPPAAAAAPTKKEPEQKKAKSGGGGGGRSRGPSNSGTRFGVWGTLTAKYVSVFYMIAGVGIFMWKMLWIFVGAGGDAIAPYAGSPVPLRVWGAGDALMGLYALGVGISVFYYETKYGLARGIYNEGQKAPNGKPSKMRAILYLIISLPGYLTLLTLLGSALFILPISLNYVSGVKNEIYIPPKPRGKRGGNKDNFDQESLGTRIFEFIAGKNPEAQFGRTFMLVLYVFLCFYTGITAVIEAEEAGTADTFTYWVHMAKFFGYIMDLNFTMLLLPVSRTLMRGIYNCATRETISLRAKCFLCFLKVVPLDEAHSFHKLLAWVGFSSAVMHTIAHIFNFGLRADAVDSKFGVPIWVTGVGLITVMLLIFTAAHNIIKKNHFELFWGTHMLFPVFLTLCLCHGCPGPSYRQEQCFFGPHYWQWILAPGGVFLIERIAREIMSRKKVCLLSFVQMGDVGPNKKTTVLSLHLDKVGIFANETREGQYAYLMCPPVSNFEWHPFTISSCPQQDDVTFHIRIIAGGWTSQVLNLLQCYAAPSDPRTVLSHNVTGLQGIESRPGRELHIDNKRLLRVYGPHSAPTQHLTKYNEVFIVTSGIGVTPLNSCMKSVVLHRWKYGSGEIKPSRVHFFWVTQHKEIERFRWFLRTVKDVCDSLSDLLEKKGVVREEKFKLIFKFHLFITRINDEVKEDQNARLREYQDIIRKPKREFESARDDYDNARERAEFARSGDGDEKQAEQSVAEAKKKNGREKC